MKQEYVSASLRWPADLKAELDRRAREDDRTFTSFVVHALRQYLKEHPRKSQKT